MVMAVAGRVTVMPLTTKGYYNPASVASAMGLGSDSGSSLVPG